MNKKKLLESPCCENCGNSENIKNNSSFVDCSVDGKIQYKTDYCNFYKTKERAQKRNANKAVEKAMKMMKIQIGDIPKPAFEYLDYLQRRVGFCGEVCLTAYAHYNQAVLNMACNDNLYKLSKEGKKWFVRNGYCK